MNYAAARPVIKSGDLLAWRGQSLIGRLIRHVTGGSYSHVGIAWHFRGRLFVLEAVEGRGVQIRAASSLPSFDWIKCGLIWHDVAEAEALSLLGKPYSYMDAIRAALGLRFQSRGYICSEYAAYVQHHAGALTGTLDTITPSALVAFWLNAGKPLQAVANSRDAERKLP